MPNKIQSNTPSPLYFILTTTLLSDTISTDINECTSGLHNCSSSRATCTNTVGSYNCSCVNPYTGDGRACNHPASGNNLALAYITKTKLSDEIMDTDKSSAQSTNCSYLLL